MQVTYDGYKFKLYIEGIRVPFIGASVQFKGMISTATIDMYPAKEFNKLPNGALLHIFFKKAGIDEEYKLLFYGTVNAKNIAIDGGNRTYSLVAYGRAAIFNNIIMASALKFETSSSAAQGLQPSKVAASTGASPAPNFQPNPGNTTTEKEAGLTVPSPTEKGGGNGSDQTLVKPAADAKNPSENIPNEMANPKGNKKPTARSLENPAVLKDVIDKLVAYAMHGSSDFYNIAYNYRLRLQPDIFINEFPAAWANYVASWGSNKQKDIFIKMLRQVIEAQHGGTSPLSGMISTLLGMYFSEAWEVPGLAKGAVLVQPDLILSDIPACNMIFPTEQISVQFSDGFGNKITRVVLESPIYDAQGNVSVNRANPQSDVAMYPDALSFALSASDKDTVSRVAQTIIIEGEEFIGSRPFYTPSPGNYLALSRNAKEHRDFAMHLYFKLRNAHTSIAITMPFSPQLIPGQRAVLFDKHTPLIFKVESVSHSIGNSGNILSSVQGSNVEYLTEETKFRHFEWYDAAYKPDAIHEVYKAYFGCTSMSESADKPGQVYAAYLDIFEKYNSTAIKTYMAEALTQRAFDTEGTVMGELFYATAKQHDGEGVIIYNSETFDNYYFKGYTIDMEEAENGLPNIRQAPVLEYVKTIYGVVGDLHE